jgi:hypothetical protein
MSNNKFTLTKFDFIMFSILIPLIFAIGYSIMYLTSYLVYLYWFK